MMPCMDGMTIDYFIIFILFYVNNNFINSKDAKQKKYEFVYSI